MIIIITDGASPETLCHGATRTVGESAGPIGRLHVSSRRVIQPSRPIRSTTAARFNRKNLAHTITFTVTRRFASGDAAAMFCMDHSTSVLAEGTLQVIESSGRQFADAIIETVDTNRVGVAVDITYTIQAGACTSFTPAI